MMRDIVGGGKRMLFLLQAAIEDVEVIVAAIAKRLALRDTGK